MASNEALLELRNVCVDYGHMRALSDISYRIDPGEVVCLLGGNASGKSTSMKAIFGTVPLAAGQVWWEGERIDRRSTVDRVRRGLAAVPEGRRVFASMSIAENLRLGAYNRRDQAAIRDDLDMVYEFFPRLKERRDQRAGTMSGGEQQMLAVGRALMSRPRLLCMDEPSMGLSPRFVRQSFEIIRRIHAAGTAVFVVEQNARAALKVAQHAYVLRGGTVILKGTAEQVARDPSMLEAYLGRTSDTPAQEDSAQGGERR